MYLARKFVAAVLLLGIALASGTLRASSDKQQDQSRTVLGRVLDSKDDPVAKAIVYLKNTKSLVVRTYITDAAGAYHFPGLSPVVDYEIYAEYEGVRSPARTLSAFDTRKQVNLTLHISPAK